MWSRADKLLAALLGAACALLAAFVATAVVGIVLFCVYAVPVLNETRVLTVKTTDTIDYLRSSIATPFDARSRALTPVADLSPLELVLMRMHDASAVIIDLKYILPTARAMLDDAKTMERAVIRGMSSAMSSAVSSFNADDDGLTAPGAPPSPGAPPDPAAPYPPTRVL